MSEEEIMPCPWCGDDGAPVLTPADLGSTRWCVECRRCYGEGPPRIIKAEAISAWNRVASLRARVADLELVLRFHARESHEVGPPSKDGHPYWLFVRWEPAADDPGALGGYFNGFRLELPDDGTGLPVLTDEARKALAGGEGTR